MARAPASLWPGQERIWKKAVARRTLWRQTERVDKLSEVASAGLRFSDMLEDGQRCALALGDIGGAEGVWQVACRQRGTDVMLWALTSHTRRQGSLPLRSRPAVEGGRERGKIEAAEKGQVGKAFEIKS